MSRTPGAKDKQKRKARTDVENLRRPKGIIADQNPDLPEGYSASRIKFMMDITPTEKLDVWDVPEMERRFRHYLEKCAEHGMKVGNMAAYYAIGIDKDTARDWVHQDRQMRNQRTLFVKKVQQICAMFREGLMEDGKINPVTGIFWQKNYDGLKDQQETIITPNNPLGDTTDPETLRRRYLERAEQPLVEQKEIFENPAEKSQKGNFSEAAPEASRDTVLKEILETGSDPGSGVDR